MARTPALSQHQPEGMCRPGDSERTCAPPPRTGTNTGPRALLRSQARAGRVQAGRRGPGAPANELSEQDSRGLAKPRSLERGYRRKKTNAPEPGCRANSVPAWKTLSLPAPKSYIWMGAGRCWSTRASSHTTPLRRQAASRNTADPNFSRSRPTQASAAPGLSPPLLPASGALLRVCRLNRSPCEGRRRTGTLCKRPPGAHDNRFERPRDEAPSPAGRSGAYRPNARARRGPLPRRGLPARDSTARSGPGRAESGRPRRRGPPREMQGPGEPEQGRFCRGLGCVNCRLKQRQKHKERKKANTEDILFCNFRV
ncbi:hypothetical protein R6Z07M_019398 [Ovis aries]